MAPSKWDEEESDSTPPSSPPPRAIPKRGGKFDDEEDDSDVLESWDAEEDSEVEREKAKKAEEAKAKAEAEAKANKKSKSQRIEEHRMANLRRKQLAEEDSSDEEDNEEERRQEMKRQEKEADLRNAADLFAAPTAVAKGEKHITTEHPDDPNQKVDLSALKIFHPTTREQFVTLRETLTPLITANSKKPQYATFLQDFAKTLSAELSSDQVKKIASSLTALSNEKMKEEKAADKGAKKSKAAKTKTTLNAGRDTVKQADTTVYDDGLADDDFM